MKYKLKDFDINDPEILNKIDQIISRLFAATPRTPKNLVNNLNDLLTIHHLIVRKKYFLTTEKRK